MNKRWTEYATVFPIKNKFELFILAPFYFLKWNRFFSTFIPFLRESLNYFNYLLSWEVCTNLQIKGFLLMKLWYTIWMYGVLNSKIAISKSTYLIFILFENAWI